MSYNNGDSNVSQNLRKVFIGGLDRATTEDDIRNQFAPFGDIEDLVVIRDKQTQQSKGFGFVTFSTVESTDACLEDRRQKGQIEIIGKQVEIKRAIPREDTSETAHIKSKKIFVGKIPWAATEDEVKEAINNWAHPVFPLKVDLIKKQDDPSKHRGFGFLEFEHEDFVDKLVIMQGLTIKDKPCDVKKAAPKNELGGGGGGGRGGGGRGGRGGGRGGFQQEYGGGFGGGYDDGWGYSGGYGGSYGGGGGGWGGSYGGGYGGGDYSYDQGGRGRGGRYRPY